MSRAYRIKVRETLRRVIRAADHVSSQLELLEVLPKEQMSEILAEELQRRGFQVDGKTARREQEGVTVTVDLESGEVQVGAESSEQVNVSGQAEGYGYDDGPDGKAVLRQQLRQQLAEDTQVKEDDLQKEVTDRLEQQLADICLELDQAVNRTTAEALKRKAAQIGQIKQLSDDPESGALTIVVEV